MGGGFSRVALFRIVARSIAAFSNRMRAADRLREIAQPMLKNQYGQYLLKVIEGCKTSGFGNLD